MSRRQRTERAAAQRKQLAQYEREREHRNKTIANQAGELRRLGRAEGDVRRLAEQLATYRSFHDRVRGMLPTETIADSKMRLLPYPLHEYQLQHGFSYTALRLAAGAPGAYDAQSIVSTRTLLGFEVQWNVKHG